MTQNLNFPARYASLTDEEMTYTEGGSLSAWTFLQGTATVVGALVLGSSFIWGISQAKNWLNNPKNHKGNIFDTVSRAMDDIHKDMSESPANFLRDSVAIATMVTVVAIPVSMAISFARSHVY